jgi:AraC family transcriptional regulator
MPDNKDLKRLVRARMAATGERYTEALAHLVAEQARGAAEIADNTIPAKPAAALAPLPGWFMAGGTPAAYEFGLAVDSTADGLPVASLRARVQTEDRLEATSFGTMMQSVSAHRYRGTRLRLAGLIRTFAVDWAALWLRIDGPSGTVAFDNMRHRAPHGTTDWAEAEIVLDVPEQATTVNFGLLLVGPGAAEVAGLGLAIVDESVGLTGRPAAEIPDSPQNLDFVARLPAN